MIPGVASALCHLLFVYWILPDNPIQFALGTSSGCHLSNAFCLKPPAMLLKLGRIKAARWHCPLAGLDQNGGSANDENGHWPEKKGFGEWRRGDA